MTEAATYSEHVCVCFTYYGLFLHGFIISHLFAPTKSMQTSERKKFVPNKKKIRRNGVVTISYNTSTTTSNQNSIKNNTQPTLLRVQWPMVMAIT